MSHGLSHCPDRGEIIIIDFEPNAGSEIGKRRPALVMSPKRYNRAVGLVLVCPVTTRIKDYPFEVVLSSEKTTGAVLADRVLSFDWRARNAQLAERASNQVLSEVQGKLLALLVPGK